MSLSDEWLRGLFLDCGLEDGDAVRAAKGTWRRLVTRKNRAKSGSKRNRSSLRNAMVTDPMVSFHRITGTGRSGLPFYDESTDGLSEVEFMFVLRDTGLTVDAALAFAKVVVELMEPKEFFAPIWRALGAEGEVSLDELRRMDWSPLRAGLPLSSREGGGVPSSKLSKHPEQRPLLTRTPTDPLLPLPGKSPK